MKALLLIDIQNDYFPDGRFELTGALEALSNTKVILEKFRQEKLPIIHVQHINIRENATFFIPETKGANIHPDLTPLEGEELIIKHFPNSFFQTALLQHLQEQQITELVVVGMMSHMCVDTTVRAAKDYGLVVTLLSDACATRDLNHDGEIIPAQWVQKSFMAALNGTFANVIKTEEYAI